jgi:WD40 repeat protein
MKNIKVFFLLCLLLSLLGCDNRRLKTSRATSVSISSDGRYVVSSHGGHYLVLWDIKNKTKKIINQTTRFYTPRFIKHSHQYVYQNMDNVLHYHDLDTNKAKTINLNFSVFGMLDTAQGLVVSDELWRLYLIKNNQAIMIKDGVDGFKSEGKLLSMSSDDSGRYLFTAGSASFKGEKLPISKGVMAREVMPWATGKRDFSLLDGVVLWDMEKSKPIKKLYGHASKTVGAISPNGQFAISGDEATRVFLWDIKKDKKVHKLASIWSGIRIGTNKETGGIIWDDTGLIKPPKDFQRCYGGTNSCSQHSSVNGLKFIAKDQYLRFTTGIHYAILYDLMDPKPKKYLLLHTDPETFVYSYLFEPTVDTAPEAGILVMSQTGNISPNYDKSVNYFGINVFKYDRQKQTLDLIWSPKGPPAHKEEK